MRSLYCTVFAFVTLPFAPLEDFHKVSCILVKPIPVTIDSHVGLGCSIVLTCTRTHTHTAHMFGL